MHTTVVNPSKVNLIPCKRCRTPSKCRNHDAAAFLNTCYPSTHVLSLYKHHLSSQDGLSHFAAPRPLRQKHMQGFPSRSTAHAITAQAGPVTEHSCDGLPSAKHYPSKVLKIIACPVGLVCAVVPARNDDKPPIWQMKQRAQLNEPDCAIEHTTCCYP